MRRLTSNENTFVADIKWAPQSPDFLKNRIYWTWQSGTVRSREQIVANSHERLQSMRSDRRGSQLQKVIMLWVLSISQRRPMQRGCILRKLAVNRYSKHYDTPWHIQQTRGQTIHFREDLQ